MFLSTEIRIAVGYPRLRRRYVVYRCFLNYFGGFLPSSSFSHFSLYIVNVIIPSIGVFKEVLIEREWYFGECNTLVDV